MQTLCIAHLLLAAVCLDAMLHDKLTQTFTSEAHGCAQENHCCYSEAIPMIVVSDAGI